LQPPIRSVASPTLCLCQGSRWTFWDFYGVLMDQCVKLMLRTFEFGVLSFDCLLRFDDTMLKSTWLCLFFVDTVYTSHVIVYTKRRIQQQRSKCARKSAGITGIPDPGIGTFFVFIWTTSDQRVRTPPPPPFTGVNFLCPIRVYEVDFSGIAGMG